MDPTAAVGIDPSFIQHVYMAQGKQAGAQSRAENLEAQPDPVLLTISVNGTETQLAAEDVISMDSAKYCDLWTVCFFTHAS